jgi:hypothetical protein
VTRLERGELALAPEEMDLSDLVRDVVARYKPELAGARCDVSVLAAAPIVGLSAWDRRTAGCWSR